MHHTHFILAQVQAESAQLIIKYDDYDKANDKAVQEFLLDLLIKDLRNRLS